jgi:hypothetical protein
MHWTEIINKNHKVINSCSDKAQLFVAQKYSKFLINYYVRTTLKNATITQKVTIQSRLTHITHHLLEKRKKTLHIYDK